MEKWLWMIAFALFPMTAWAQPGPPPSGSQNRVVMEPVEIDTIGCRFNSWTLTAAGTVTVALIGIPAQSDSTPSAIVTAGPSLSDNIVTVQLTPAYGCGGGTTDCRNGNSYQIRLQPTAGADKPTCNFRLDVRKVVYNP